jgi:hypothetical protein
MATHVMIGMLAGNFVIIQKFKRAAAMPQGHVHILMEPPPLAQIRVQQVVPARLHITSPISEMAPVIHHMRATIFLVS